MHETENCTPGKSDHEISDSMEELSKKMIVIKEGYALF